MHLLSYISKYMENIAPLDLSEPWDNCGWQIFINDIEIDKALLTLSLTLDSINFAKTNGYKLIIAHHPLIFNPIKSVNYNNSLSQTIIEAIKSDISIYSMHTNLDKIEEGVSDLVSKKLGIANSKPILPEKNNPHIGLGRYGSLQQAVYLDELLNNIKYILEIEQLKVTNYHNKLIRSIALCCGSGSSLISHLPDNIDVFITGDIKYHDVVDISNLVIVDANHHNTEMPVLNKLQEYLSNINIKSEIFKAENPWQII